MNQPYRNPRIPKHLRVPAETFQYFRGEIYVVGTLGEAARGAAFAQIDGVVAEIQHLHQGASFGGVTRHFVIIDATEPVPGVRLIAPEEVAYRKKRSGRSTEKVLAHIFEHGT